MYRYEDGRVYDGSWHNDLREGKVPFSVLPRSFSLYPAH